MAQQAERAGERRFAAFLTNGDIVVVAAERMDVQGGCLQFFGPGETGLTLAYERGAWDAAWAIAGDGAGNTDALALVRIEDEGLRRLRADRRRAEAERRGSGG